MAQGEAAVGQGPWGQQQQQQQEGVGVGNCQPSSSASSSNYSTCTVAYLQVPLLLLLLPLLPPITSMTTVEAGHPFPITPPPPPPPTPSLILTGSLPPPRIKGPFSDSACSPPVVVVRGTVLGAVAPAAVAVYFPLPPFWPPSHPSLRAPRLGIDD